MAKEIDLDEVNLTADAVAAWTEMVGRVALVLAQMKRMGREIPEIPIERARVEDDRTLTVYVNMPGVLNISMSIPADQWVWRDPNKRH